MARCVVASGIHFQQIGANTIGIAARRNTLRHPYNGKAHMPKSAPAMPPNCIPEEMPAIKIDRLRPGTHSLANATIFGTIPPLPTPNMKRQNPNTATLLETPEKNIDAAHNRTVATIIVRRPIRSASGPSTRAPAMVPNDAALPMAPACAGVMPKLFISNGIAAP